MTRYLSGRSRRRPQSQLREDRNRYFAVDQAEPNLGDPTELDVESNLPPGQQYQIVSVIGSLGERYWIPRGGGLIPGSITVFDEDVIIPNNSGISSITQLIFKGDAIRAEGYLNLDGSPGIGATITVFSPGTQGQFIVNNNDEFYGAPSISYDVGNDYVGIGTSSPTQILDINGDIRLRGTIYDWNNDPGTQGYIIVKNIDGGLSWVDPNSMTTGAGGTIGQIQFHSNTGLVDGAEIFYYDFVNNRVGIGSTQPKYLLDVSGISSFTGTTYIDNLSVTNLGKFNNLTVNGITTFKDNVDAEIGASLNDVRIGITNSNEINTSSGNLILNSQSGEVSVDDNLTVTGVSSVGFITARDVYVSGILTAVNLDFLDTSIRYLKVVGIATINVADIPYLSVTGVATNKDLDVTNYLDVSGNANFQNLVDINNLRVTGIATIDNIVINGNTIGSSSGNLIIDSAGIVRSKDVILVDEETESTSTSTGSLTTKGGIGIFKNANIGGNFKVDGNATLASNGGITTTGGDFYVGGDLYINDDLTFDDVKGKTGNFSVSLTTKDLKVTGLSTFQGLMQVNTGIVPDVDESAYLGTSELPFSEAHIGNIQISPGNNNNRITTGSGDLTLDSNGNNINLGNNELVDKVTFKVSVDSNIIPSIDKGYNIGSSTLKWDQIYAREFVGQFIGNADIATNLAGGTAGDIPYQTAENTTTFLADPGSSGDGYVLTWNNGSTAPQWSDLTNLPGAGYNIDVIQTGGNNTNPAIRLSDGNNNDDITIVGGSNVNVTRNSNSQLTISAVAGAGLTPNATIEDIINVNGGTISADDAGADKIFFWDDSQGKATHLSVGTGLEINGTTLSANSGAGKTYTLEAVDSGSNAILRLSDGTTNNDVTITAGSNITIDPVAAGGFTISAASLGGISGIEVSDSGASQGTDITILNFTGDISASASGNTATINVDIPTDVSDLTDDNDLLKTTNASTITVNHDNETNDFRWVLFTDALNDGQSGRALIDRSSGGMYYKPSTNLLYVTALSAQSSERASEFSYSSITSPSEDGYVVIGNPNASNNGLRAKYTLWEWSYDNFNIPLSLNDVSINTPNLIPVSDNARDIGAGTRRWGTVYAATGTINTSDQREKNNITKSNLGLDFIKKLNPVSFKFNVGSNLTTKDEDGNKIITPISGERIHYGLIAQEVKKVLDELNIEDFAGWILSDKNNANSSQGLRYSEFISPIIKAIQEQQEIINVQKEEIDTLKDDRQTLETKVSLLEEEIVPYLTKAIQEQQELIESQKVEIESIKSRLDNSGL